MKKAILFIISFMISACISFNVQAQTWYTANQVTVAWNPVTTLADGAAKTISTNDPSGGNDGDIWFKYTA